MKPTLTIAIPTYNRPERLEERLQELLPMLTADMELLIVDNCSDTNSNEMIVQEFRASGVESALRYVRNSANIGLAANICRCYELSSGEWVWTLGDDDRVSAGCLVGLFSLIAEADAQERGGGRTVSAIFCSTGIFQNPTRTVSATVEEFWKAMSIPKVFSNHLFLTSNVIRVSCASKNLGVGYKNVYSAAPHLAIASMSVLQGGEVWTDPLYLADWKEPESSQRWNCLSVALGLPSLMDIPGLDQAVLRYLAPGLQLVLWKPFLVGGAKLILLDAHKSSRFWSVVLSRLFPFLMGRKKLFAVPLIMLAKLCEWLPWVRQAAGGILRRFGIKSENIMLGQARL